MQSFKKKLGKAIRDRRKEVGYKTQVALAEAIGTDQHTVARWETGVYEPSDAHKDLLKKLLDVSDDFFDPAFVDAPEVKKTHDRVTEVLLKQIDSLEKDVLSLSKQLSAELIPGVSVSSLLSQIQSTTPLHRKVVLAILFRNPALVRDESKEFAHAVQALLKVP